MKRQIADVTYSSGTVQLRGNNVNDVMIAFCRDSSNHKSHGKTLHGVHVRTSYRSSM